MTDAADRAQAREEQERMEAIERRREAADRATAETPFEIEGTRVCLDCFDPISKKRLKANPQAVRCIDCQTDVERSGRGPA